LDPAQCDKSGLTDEIPERCKKVITNAKKLGVPPFMRVANIIEVRELFVVI